MDRTPAGEVPVRCYVLSRLSPSHCGPHYGVPDLPGPEVFAGESAVFINASYLKYWPLPSIYVILGVQNGCFGWQRSSGLDIWVVHTRQMTGERLLGQTYRSIITVSHTKRDDLQSLFGLVYILHTF